MLDESNQTHSVVTPKHTVLEDIKEMPNLMFDVSKEYQTTMHAKVPSQQDPLAAKNARSARPISRWEEKVHLCRIP